MNLKHQALALAVTLSAGLVTGCGSNEGEVAEPNFTGTMLTTAPSAEKKEAEKQARANAKVPLSSYVMISPDEDQVILTKLLIAKSGDLFSEDETLSFLSAQYYNERDAFKKKDIAKALLPEFNKELKELASTSYLAVPIERVGFQEKGRSVFHMEPLRVLTYNFDLGGFPLASRYGAKDCWDSSFQNNQRISVSISGPDAPCFLTVKDEAQARSIETALQSNNLRVQGTAYMHLTARSRNLYGQVLRAKIELTHEITKERLGTFDL